MKCICRSMANFLSYKNTKYYQNWSTSDGVIIKIIKVTFFLNMVYIEHKTEERYSTPCFRKKHPRILLAIS